MIVDVELGDGHLTGELIADFLQRRADHLTGTAPLRPEIDKHGRVGRDHVRVEAGIGNRFGRHDNLTHFNSLEAI